MKSLNIILRHTGFLLFILLPILVTAQVEPKGNSPYSRFGLGDIQNNDFHYLEQMGSLGASYFSTYNINIANPASLSYLKAASFDVGVHARLFSFDDGTQVLPSVWSGNMSYLSLAFPLQNALNDLLDRKVRDFNFGMAFTLKPVSTVGYNVSSVFIASDVGEVVQNYQGSGGTYDFTWSNSMRYKDLSFGMNLGYLFGNSRELNTIQFADLQAQPTIYERNNNFSGFVYRAGLIYDLKFKPKVTTENKTEPLKHISFGLYANSNSKLTMINDQFSGSVNAFNQRDTLLSSINTLQTKLPANLGIGMTYFSGEKLAIGVNYETNNWSAFDSRYVNGSLKDAYKLSLGGYIRPNYKSIGNYFARVYYRFGAYYSKLPTVIDTNNGVDIEDMGLSFGLGLPFYYQRKISHANIGISVGQKGRNTILKENYVRLTFSFTFNDDEWFVKRKYN